MNCIDDLRYLAFKMERRKWYLLASCQPCQGTKTRKCFLRHEDKVKWISLQKSQHQSRDISAPNLDQWDACVRQITQ